MKLIEKVKNAKILKGYVKNRTKEVALAAIFAALIGVGRKINILSYFGFIVLDLTIVFWSTAVIILSYPYVWLIAGIMALSVPVAATMPVTFLCLSISLNIFYFINKAIGIRRARYFIFFTSFLTMINAIIILDYLKILQWEFVIIPFMTKAFLQGILAFIAFPYIIKVLKNQSILDGD